MAALARRHTVESMPASDRDANSVIDSPLRVLPAVELRAVTSVALRLERRWRRRSE